MSKRPHYGMRLPSRMTNGYVRIYCPGHPMANGDGYALEHRKVMYDAGFDPTGKHVHHVNGDKDDNRLENLRLEDQGAHHRLHIQEAGIVRNQYGVWPVLSPEIRRRLNQQRAAERQRQRVVERAATSTKGDAQCVCVVCGVVLVRKRTGRPPLYCSSACSWRARQEREAS